MSAEAGRFSDEVVIVTGVARGIGHAIMKRLGIEGAFVGAGVRKEEDMTAVAEALRAEGIEGMPVLLDMTKPDTFQTAREQVAAEADQPVTALVNNAGITRDTIAMRMTEQDFRDVLETNLVGPFLLIKEVLPAMMKARRGNILNVSSVVGIHGEYGQTNYAASKGGLNPMTRSVAREYVSRNIRVNALALGLVDTDMTSVLPQEAIDKMLEQIPLGRPFAAEEAAQAAADTMASGLNGAVVVADGGYTRDVKGGGDYRYWEPGQGIIEE